MITWMTASLSSNTYNKASWREDWTFWGNGINVFQYIDLPLKYMMFVNIIIRLLDLSETWETFPKTETIRSHISRAGKPSNLNPVAKDNFRFCWTVWNWSLFLAHPTYWNKCMTSENAQCSSRSGFRIFKISLDIRVLKVPVCIVCSITHMTIMFVFTSLMNVWNQSIQTLVTCFGPFRNRSFKFFISEQLDSIRVTLLQQISFLL